MILQLRLGDPYADGHGVTGEVFIECNKDSVAVMNAYYEGKEALGIDLSENICRDYEDSSISAEDVAKLREAGLDIEDEMLRADDYNPEEDDPDDYKLNEESFAEIYLFIATKGDPEIEWKHTSIEFIEIGGYGLYQ